MSIKIHHGSPGTYKTAGAMQDDLIVAARQGRQIVTNIRGAGNEQQWHEVLGSLPEEFEIICVDTSNHEGRERMRRWFHWAPKGALICIDEINTIYTKGWTARELGAFDYPGGLDVAQQDGRPCNVLEAFEMHRHYNWDIVATSPSWKKVHPSLQECAEGGYRHHNRKMQGLTGYLEIFHLADNSGLSKGDEITVTKKKIRKQTFRLYKSTTTGEVTDTIAGQNVFLRPGPIFALILIVTLTSGLIYAGPPEALHKAWDYAKSHAHKENTASPGGATSSQVSTAPAMVADAGAVSTTASDPPPVIHHWLDDYQAVYYVGQVAARSFIYVGHNGDDGMTYDDRELGYMEVNFHALTRCVARLFYAGKERIIHCPPADRSPGLIDRVKQNVSSSGSQPNG
jgi:zona occludens toxin